MTTPEPKSDVTRFGILYGGGALEDWQSQCLEVLMAVPGVRAEVSISPEPPPVPLRGASAELPHVPMGGGRRSDYDLDFIMCFLDADLPAEIIDWPRHGVWRYQFGDWVNYRGSPGFWEVYEHCEVTSAMLVRVHRDPDTVVVLRQGFLRTRQLSARKNRQQMLERFTHWPAQECRAIAAGGAGRGRAPTVLQSIRRPRSPTLRQRTLLAARIAGRAAATGYRALFRHDQWNVGIVDRPIADFLTLTAKPEIRWLPATRRSEMRADPFGIVFGGRPMIFCEHYNYGENLGYIVAFDAQRADAAIRVRIGPQMPVHLSYPFLFEAGGRLLCVPESSAAQEIALYESEEFPQRWRRIATLIEGRGFADATLFQHQGRWWLSASDVADKGANSELYLWFADAPDGPWQAHSGNPVKIDVRSARPAGTPFVSGGVLYRPAQDCSSTYGARVTINRVLALTPDDFFEEVATTVDPDPAGRYPAGLHTLSTFGDKTLLDGKRSIFAAGEFLRTLRHFLG